MVQWLAAKHLAWEAAPAAQAQQELIERGFFTGENLNAAFKALTRAGSLETDPLAPRPLSEHQKRSIALQASTSGFADAVARYLQLRLPENAAYIIAETFDLEEMYDRLADPDYKAVIEEAAWWCWQQARADFAPTKERLNFMHSYLAGRIPTAPLLDAAWQACKEYEKDALRSAVLRQTSEPEQIAEPDLDRLSDEEIGSLYHLTLRRVAEDARRSPVRT